MTQQDGLISVSDVERFADTLAVLAAETVQKANSGHPGAPLGMARMLSELYLNHVRVDPAHPHWFDRDRFILSAGHASAGLYSLLHLSGYPISIEDLKQFRQWGSITPGHPERHLDLGIEMTTGPLGQGLATAVGVALGEKHLQAEFNQPGQELLTHRVYVVASEGDIMEGISAEACSLAGHWGLDNLTVLLDRNHICIDGPTDLSFSEEIRGRFEAQKWFVQEIDGHDIEAIRQAVERSKQEAGRPSLIICNTHIGWRSAKQDSAGAHGEPLGQDNLQAFKTAVGATGEFNVPAEVAALREAKKAKGAELFAEFEKRFETYEKTSPALAAEFVRRQSGELPTGWEGALPFAEQLTSVATRKASGNVLDALVPVIPELIGGSADLTPSNNTRAKGMEDMLPPTFGGRYVHYGIREFAMGTILNGIAVEGGLIPYGGTFMVFSDYMKPAIRLAALMKIRVVYVLTHDSIGLGEDGPTHQPIEHLAALRSIPGLQVIRPADANETSVGWKMALSHQGPTALVLSRQNLKVLTSGTNQDAERGAYILSVEKGTDISRLHDGDGVSTKLDMILVATGSEVSLAFDVADLLSSWGKSVRVVTMPCWEVYRTQSRAYQHMLLPEGVRKVGIEAASSFGWHEWVDEVIAIEGFGASAPGEIVMEKYGFTTEAIAKKLA